MSSRGEMGRLSLDEFVAFNEELVALVRAGVPLERGLVSVGGDWRGRLGRVSEGVGRRMEAEGCTLAEAVAVESNALPELYGAVIEAGLRSGRLTAALEGLTGLVRSRIELRRTIHLAMLYPAIILVMAYTLFLVFITLIAPRLVANFQSLGASVTSLRILAGLGDSVAIWGPIGFGVLVIGLVLWIRSGRASMLGSDRWSGVGLGFPGVRGLIRLARSGMFAELLALLIENRVPMPDALTLSARAVGDSRLRAASDRVAGALWAGEDLPHALPKDVSLAFPPMLRWLIISGSAQGDLPHALRVAARSYSDRAQFRAELLRLVAPTVLMVGIGGITVLFYGLVLFVPFSELLIDLS